MVSLKAVYVKNHRPENNPFLKKTHAKVAGSLIMTCRQFHVVHCLDQQKWRHNDVFISLEIIIRMPPITVKTSFWNLKLVEKHVFACWAVMKNSENRWENLVIFRNPLVAQASQITQFAAKHASLARWHCKNDDQKTFNIFKLVGLSWENLSKCAVGSQMSRMSRSDNEGKYRKRETRSSRPPSSNSRQ